jgi:DivIVA domain-containing protein
MSAVELDRQGIERRDFPIVRRGYDPASVDAHLRALAGEIDELQREASNRGGESLASSAGTQVQGILEAAQQTAETIERQAAEQAHDVREAADEDARRTREEAVARAQEYVAAVSRATEALLAHVGSLDEETRALVESMRSGAGRLAGDLSTVESEMGALYDAASGRSAGGYGSVEDAATGVGAAVGAAAQGATHGSTRAGVHENGGSHASGHGPVDAPAHSPAHTPLAAQAATGGANVEPSAQAYVDEFFESEPGEGAYEEPPLFADEPAEEHLPANTDLDGARLVALNMALNGDSREDTSRYLEENFAVPDRERLLDEVYAAIEG